MKVVTRFSVKSSNNQVIIHGSIIGSFPNDPFFVAATSRFCEVLGGHGHFTTACHMFANKNYYTTKEKLCSMTFV